MYEELVKKLRYCGNAVSCLHCPYWEGCAGSKEDLTEAADDIEKLEKAVPRWIPVTEKLPTDQRPVLVCVSPYTVGEGKYVGYVGMAYFTYSPNGGFWCGTGGNIYGAIGFIHVPSYWMPLPEPPKEET